MKKLFLYLDKCVCVTLHTAAPNYKKDSYLRIFSLKPNIKRNETEKNEGN